jgi:hypothetical protein
MEKKHGPTGPYVMTANGRMIARYERKNKQIVNRFMIV